jgi:single-stranded DNA-binding protein
MFQGNLVDVPVVRGNDPEKPVVNFRIGCTDGHDKYKKTIFVTCVAFGSAAKAMKTCVEKELLPKGLQILVQGKLRENNYENKDGNEVRGFELELDRFDGWEFCGNANKSEAVAETVSADQPF